MVTLAASHAANIIRKTKITYWCGVEVLKGLLYDVLEEYVEENMREWAPLNNSYSCSEKFSKLVI